MSELDIRERLAEYAHSAWSGWMRYMFGKGRQAEDGSWVMPKDSVDRWQRQMNTPYHDLPESEKQSDRKEADEILALLGLVRPTLRADCKALLERGMHRMLETGRDLYEPDTIFQMFGAAITLLNAAEEATEQRGLP